jgi:hypothetical protein
MSLVDEYRMFTKKYWRAAQEERDAYGDARITYEDYVTQNEEYLLDKWHLLQYDSQSKAVW